MKKHLGGHYANVDGRVVPAEVQGASGQARVVCGAQLLADEQLSSSGLVLHSFSHVDGVAERLVAALLAEQKGAVVRALTDARRRPQGCES